MILSILFSFLLSLNSSAQNENHFKEISLKKIFDQLRIGKIKKTGIEINPDGSPGATTFIKGMYPISAFSASTDGQRIVLSFHKAEVPEGSDLDTYKVIVKIENNEASIETILYPFKEKTPEKSTADADFIDSKTVRIEMLKNKDGELTSDYFFYDLNSKSHQHFSELEQLKSLGQIKRVRALNKNAYLVYHVENEVHKATVIWLNADQLSVMSRVSLPSMIPGHDLLVQNLIPERSVRTSFDGTVFINYAFLQEDEWKNAYVKINPNGQAECNQIHGSINVFEARIDGAPELLSIGDENEISIADAKTRRIVKRWIFKEQQSYYGGLYRVKDGYIFEATNHPYYGYIWLKDDGSYKHLTDPKFRLVHSQITQDFIFGVGQQKEDGSISFHVGDVESLSEKQRLEKLADPLVLNRNKYETVATFSRGRYLIVKLSVLKLGIVDTQMDDQIIRTIDLQDEYFQVVTHASSIEIRYPVIKAREAYSFATLKKFLNEPKGCSRFLK